MLLRQGQAFESCGTGGITVKLKIVHLFPELMSLYGEYANLALLSRRLERMGVTVGIVGIDCDSVPDFSDADMIYMGAGTERSQKHALKKLAPYAGALRTAAQRGAVVLFTGNAMPMLGKTITDARGTHHDALALADFTTVESDKRIGVDIIAVPTLWDEQAVGFMNKCSVTTGIATPLFSALPLGFGNESEGGTEGFANGSVFATHITGPVLVKNPAFTDHVIRRLFAAKGWELPEQLPRLPHEQEAYEVTLRDLQARVK